MKYTITIKDYLQSELINSGKSELFNNTQLTMLDPEFAFMQKAMRYDEDIDDIVTNRIFNGFRFVNDECDKWFKRAFVNRFYNRQIGRQTIEAFATQVVYTTLINEQEINYLYDNYVKMLQNSSITTNKGSSESENQNRDISTTLPQNQVNMDLQDMGMAYADENNIAKANQKNKNQNTSETTNISHEGFKAMQNAWEKYFNEYDRRCFLHVW